MAAQRPSAFQDQRGVRRGERGDAEIFHAVPPLVLPARRQDGRAVRIRSEARCSDRASLLLARRRVAIDRVAVVANAGEVESRARRHQRLARAGDARSGARQGEGRQGPAHEPEAVASDRPDHRGIDRSGRRGVGAVRRTVFGRRQRAPFGKTLPRRGGRSRFLCGRREAARRGILDY